MNNVLEETTVSNYGITDVGGIQYSSIRPTEIFRQALDVLDKDTKDHYEMFKAYLLALNNVQITQPFLDVTNRILERLKSDVQREVH